MYATGRTRAPFLSQLEKLNDSIYSVQSPPEGRRPSVEIVLFHGLQLEGFDDAYIISWVSRHQSKPESWVKWILEDDALKDARILLISYDASVRKTKEEGRMGMHNTSENLILDLIDTAQVGHDGWPVILVGHCLGGLLMKELCVQPQNRLRLRSEDKINQGVQNFLVNLQGFFCYGSPHHGTELATISTFSEGPLFKCLTTLKNEAERRKENFRTLRQKYGWRTFGTGESVPVKLVRRSSRYHPNSIINETSLCQLDVHHSGGINNLKNDISSESISNVIWWQNSPLRNPESYFASMLSEGQELAMWDSNSQFPNPMRPS